MLTSEEQRQYVRLQAALAIASRAEALDAMTDIAALYTQQGNTQESAEVLAFVLLQPDLPTDTRERAEEHFEDLESRICPRVIWDAREFARYATFEDVVAFIFAD